MAAGEVQLDRVHHLETMLEVVEVGYRLGAMVPELQVVMEVQGGRRQWGKWFRCRQRYQERD
jgi:hypothetical protein